MQTTAPLIPTPRKSRRRWYAIAGFLALVVAAPYAGMCFSEWLCERELAQIYAEIDARDPDWRWADLMANMPALPDERNAAEQIKKISELLNQNQHSPWVFKTRGQHLNTKLSDEQLKSLANSLDKAGPQTLEEVRKLTAMPEGRLLLQPVGENVFEGMNTPLRSFLPVMYFLQDDALLRCHDADKDGAAESSQALLNAAHAIDDFPGLFATIVRSALADSAVGALERTLGQGEVSLARLGTLQTAMVIEAEHNGLYPAMRGERAGAHEYYLQVRDGKASYEPFHAQEKASRVERVFYFFSPGSMANAYADRLRFCNEQVRASKLPDHLQAEAFARLGTSQSKQSFPARALNAGVKYVDLWIEEEKRTQAHLRCAIVAVAAERYRLKYETWPADSDELVKAGLLKGGLKDPYDGQPLRWKKTPDNIIIYSIYSVGKTKLDDDGKLDRFNRRENGFVLWIPAMRGLPAPAVETAPK